MSLRLPSWFALLGLFLCSLPLASRAESVEFKLPAQPADTALLAFSKQSKTEVLFSFADLRRATSTAVTGRHEPEAAIQLLLQGTGFAAQRNGAGKWVITPAARPTGALRGRLLNGDGTPATGVRVTLPRVRLSETTDARGEFAFTAVPPGVYEVVAAGEGYDSLEFGRARIDAAKTVTLPARTIQFTGDPSRLAPYVVETRIDRARFSDRDELHTPPREATGNLDLVRTQNDAINFTIYDRDQISRSGVVSLNEFLQRELLDANSAARSAEQDATADLFKTGSTNLSLRGYTTDETVVLVNGRRLPEVLLSGGEGSRPPDVNFIPLSLVQQIEVLPASASSLYTGNPVGGVINIVLRPGVDANATELTATYTNALRSFDAPQSTLSLLHAESLLGGSLRVRLNASTTSTTPPTESELRFQSRHPLTGLQPWSSVFRTTPTIRSLDIQPLFGPGTPAFTSVAPGADGSGGLAAFNGRQGVRNLALFDPPGDLSVSNNSVGFPYGREQRREAYFGSVTYDAFPNLELGFDLTYARTVAHRGLDVFPADLFMAGVSPFNPFKHDILVSLNEVAPQLGENYSESRVEFASAVLGAILKLPANWRLSLDGQYGHSVTKFRGLAGTDRIRWQQLVDDGRYNPLRDTQVVAPPKAFYDEVLVFRGDRGKFVTLGDYHVLDLAARATNDSLPLPTGRGVFNFGGDFRQNRLVSFTERKTYFDGTLAEAPYEWEGRTIRRYSVFGELQAPVLPTRWLPRAVRKIETDLAVRYIASSYSKEANIAPTFAGTIDVIGGFSVRGSFTTSNRFPSPTLSRLNLPPPTIDLGPNYKLIKDPLRGGAKYEVASAEIPNFTLASEAAVTQTVGVLYKRATKGHRFRASVDFVDTRKTNELVFLSEETLIDLEHVFPDRVLREPLAPGDPNKAGRLIGLYTGTINGANRRSLNWNTSVDYAWSGVFGGTVDVYGRLLYFQRYKSQIAPGYGQFDQLRRPDGTAPGLLKYRSNFGASWTRPDLGFGIDGHYFHSRVIPFSQWLDQGHDRIRPVWQFDPYVQFDLARFLPWRDQRYGLRAQLRVNNILGAPFPKYVYETSGSGVQPYGDWRGRTYSLSLTASF